jgi:hypothetical protein
MRKNHRRFATLCVLTYVALSWATRFDMGLGTQMASLVYPLDTFSMYAGPPGDSIGHLLVRGETGEIHRVRDFSSYRCDEPVERSAARCADKPGFAYHYDDLARYIETHPGGGQTAVELVYRIWRLQSGEAPTVASDCVLARCTVAP